MSLSALTSGIRAAVKGSETVGGKPSDTVAHRNSSRRVWKNGDTVGQGGTTLKRGRTGRLA